jgi:hypothetical protein
MIPSLIDKQDNFEIVRDQIAGILATEIQSQMALATIAAQNPNDYKLRIFAERSNPWEEYLNDDPDTTPIVNVWFENSNFEGIASNISERQKCGATYNVDCYGYGIASDVLAGGHLPGDLQASLAVHKTIRLVRNILMSSEYTYLGLRGVVWKRWISSITVFQPTQDNRAMHQLVGSRLAFQIEFNEYSPQYIPETLDYVAIDINRAENGEILVELDYDYT